MSRPKFQDQPYRRGRRHLPERITRLRWLRDAAADPAGCERRTVIDDAEVTARPRRNGVVELRVTPPIQATRLADEFFGRRYETAGDADGVVLTGRPV